MRNYVIGTLLVIAGGITVVAFSLLGVSSTLVAAICMGMAVAGFALQMFGAFRMKSKFEREFRESQQADEALLQRARSLPPEEGTKLLLRSLK